MLRSNPHQLCELENIIVKLMDNWIIYCTLTLGICVGFYHTNDHTVSKCEYTML